MREPFLSETPAAFRKIPNRSGRAGRKGVEGEGNSRPALAFRKNFAVIFKTAKESIKVLALNHIWKNLDKFVMILPLDYQTIDS